MYPTDWVREDLQLCTVPDAYAVVLKLPSRWLVCFQYIPIDSMCCQIEFIVIIIL